MSAIPLLSYTDPSRRLPLGAFPHVAPRIIPHAPIVAVFQASRETWGAGYHATHPNGKHLTGCMIVHADFGTAQKEVERAARNYLKRTLKVSHPGFKLDGVCACKVTPEARS